MTITPNAMPRKANPIHQQLLSGLLETKPVSWVRKRIDPETNGVVQTKVTGTALRFPLAQNMSNLNVDRAAKRWMR
ncbi:hypothetical protein [Mycobacterium intracellulare]|uniref:Uncharacterized protein n=1 Tax=Mycobacterium intracellulare TaxID=1767 RepID=A0AAE4R871_MYCIT|nr:hypothetical protein [Mycobacterium intracellulare]MDV6975302.1 hypothetical protein [Mycobacterium intracellulare]MDV6980366.1 hypothetical protein [Mycobacterium intracellulare]MDV7010795.1 hypothetical protein [Mycobacterium intracellulare]MDV7025701.1 hypothetical protein [Mycobacterium intracellulare]